MSAEQISAVKRAYLEGFCDGSHNESDGAKPHQYCEKAWENSESKAALSTQPQGGLTDTERLNWLSTETGTVRRDMMDGLVPSYINWGRGVTLRQAIDKEKDGLIPAYEPLRALAPQGAVAGILKRYEDMRLHCVHRGNLHPDSKEACHQALKNCRTYGMEMPLAALLDDMALALKALATQPQAPQGAVTDKSHIVVTKTTDGAIVAVTRQDEEGRIIEIIAQDTQKPTGRCQRILREEGLPYPRTCQVCGLGKCHYSSPAAPETPEGKK